MNGVVRIYTDGACHGNPGPGGWGAILEYGSRQKEIFGYELQTTNNRMEIKAAIEGLKNIKKSCNIEIYTDSRYLQMGITQWIYNWLKCNWKTSNNKLVKNSDLWQELYIEVAKHQNVLWYWVKGHADNKNNNIADRLANDGKITAIKMLECRK